MKTPATTKKFRSRIEQMKRPEDMLPLQPRLEAEMTLPEEAVPFTKVRAKTTRSRKYGKQRQVTPVSVEVVQTALQRLMVVGDWQQVDLLEDVDALKSIEEQMKRPEDTPPLPLSLQPELGAALPVQTKAQTKTKRTRRQGKQRKATPIVEVVRTPLQPLMVTDSQQQVLLSEEQMKPDDIEEHTKKPEDTPPPPPPPLSLQQPGIEVATPLLAQTKTTRTRKQGKQRQVTPMAVEVVRTPIQPLMETDNPLSEEQMRKPDDKEEQMKRPEDMSPPPPPISLQQPELGAVTPLAAQTKAKTRKQGKERQVTPMAVEVMTPLQSMMMSGHQQQLLLQEEHMKRTGSGRVLTLQELTAAR